MKTPALLGVSFVLCAGLASPAQTPKQPVDYVSPNIGGIGQLLTSTRPVVQRPHGMAMLAPITTPGITDHYLADRIFGFPAGSATLMASTGEVATSPAGYASAFDHDLETATPYYYEAELETWQIRAELTATNEAAYYRFTFPASPHAHLVLELERNAGLTIEGDRTVAGSEQVGEDHISETARGKTREYFYAEFSRPFGDYQTWQDAELGKSSHVSGDRIGFVTSMSTSAGESVEVRIGISYISVEQAKQNLQRELPDWNFEAVKQASRKVWNDALSRIDIAGGSERQRTIFYTALYRSLSRMTDITENGRYFSGYDHQVHEADGHDFYVDDGTWDTFRSMHPLQLLIEPDREQDMIRSYIRMYQQSGWMPSFPSVAGDQAVMIGHHADQVILDAYARGYRDFDVDAAYAGMRKNATEATMLPWSRAPLTPLVKI